MAANWDSLLAEDVQRDLHPGGLVGNERAELRLLHHLLRYPELLRDRQDLVAGFEIPARWDTHHRQISSTVMDLSFRVQTAAQIRVHCTSLEISLGSSEPQALVEKGYLHIVRVNPSLLQPLHERSSCRVRHPRRSSWRDGVERKLTFPNCILRAGACPLPTAWGRSPLRARGDVLRCAEHRRRMRVRLPRAAGKRQGGFVACPGSRAGVSQALESISARCCTRLSTPAQGWHVAGSARGLDA